jgi:hypothetical protein
MGTLNPSMAALLWVGYTRLALSDCRSRVCRSPKPYRFSSNPRIGSAVLLSTLLTFSAGNLRHYEARQQYLIHPMFGEDDSA